MAWFGLIDFKMLLFENPGGALRARGKQVDKTALCACAARGLRRSEGVGRPFFLLAEPPRQNGGRSMRAVKNNLITLFREYRGEHGKESFAQKTRCTIARPNLNDCLPLLNDECLCVFRPLDIDSM